MDNLLIVGRKLTVVHGAAPRGADYLAHVWCVSAPEVVEEEEHPADWKRHGKAAGMRRNAEMASLGADMCVAFWDGKSRGTLHCLTCCVELGIPVRIVPKARRPA